MSLSASLTKTLTLAGKNFSQSTAPTAEAAICHELSIPAGAAGTLSTRTDADTGVVTVDDSGHAFVDTDRVDIYWANGSRHGMAVSGAPTGNAITIDGGAGDDLPAALSSVTLVEPTLLDLSVLGTLVTAILLATTQLGWFVFADSGGTTHFAQRVGSDMVWDWQDGNGDANPITGDQIDKVWLSHGAAAAKAMKVGILHDNS